VASLCIDNLQKEANRRESSQDRKTTALISRPSQSDYSRIAKQVREWSFRFDGAEKPFEFLEQVEWSANTYGMELDMIPRAMPELLKGKALKWFIVNNKQYLGREERDRLLVSVLVTLKQYRADANVGCVALDVEMFLEISMNQDRRARQGQPQVIHCLCGAGA